eukprot:3400-Heterococcus_DN1.PRE.4
MHNNQVNAQHAAVATTLPVIGVPVIIDVQRVLRKLKLTAISRLSQKLETVGPCDACIKYTEPVCPLLYLVKRPRLAIH